MLFPLAGGSGAVIKLGELVMILDLHRQGLSVSAIARHLCIDRKTVRSAIAKGLEPPKYKTRPPSGADRGGELSTSRARRSRAGKHPIEKPHPTIADPADSQTSRTAAKKRRPRSKRRLITPPAKLGNFTSP
jgi:hypothetical protein